jgi:hypothetical protein
MPARCVVDGRSPKTVPVAAIKQSRVSLRTIACDSAVAIIAGQPHELRCDHSCVTYGRRLRSVSVAFELTNTQADRPEDHSIDRRAVWFRAARPCAHCQPASLSRMRAYPIYGNVTDAVEPHRLKQ